jgi:hypothetical protein
LLQRRFRFRSVCKHTSRAGKVAGFPASAFAVHDGSGSVSRLPGGVQSWCPRRSSQASTGSVAAGRLRARLLGLVGLWLAPSAFHSAPRVERGVDPRGLGKWGVSLFPGASASPAPGDSSFGGSRWRPSSSRRLMGRSQPGTVAAARSRSVSASRGDGGELTLATSVSRRTARAAGWRDRSPRSGLGATARGLSAWGGFPRGRLASVSSTHGACAVRTPSRRENGAGGQAVEASLAGYPLPRPSQPVPLRRDLARWAGRLSVACLRCGIHSSSLALCSASGEELGERAAAILFRKLRGSTPGRARPPFLPSDGITCFLLTEGILALPKNAPRSDPRLDLFQVRSYLPYDT